MNSKTQKHAYLIMAHTNWNQLKILIQLLDYEYNDIFIHIDKKVTDCPTAELMSVVRKSSIHIYSEYKVYWGGFCQVETELLLFEKAHKGRYTYYHVISGMDLPLKSQFEIHYFFNEHKGKEFVHFGSERNQSKEIERRTRLYHFLHNYRRRYSVWFLNELFTFLERSLLLAQIVLKIDRTRKYRDFTIKYGSNWVSITDDMVAYILDNKKKIRKIFKWTNSGDELFVQSLIYNSSFREHLYCGNDDCTEQANLRYLDFVRGKNGNPYVWRITDLEELRMSDCLFARKFDECIDGQIIQVIYEAIINNSSL